MTREVVVDVAGMKAHCLAALVQQSTPWATEALAELVRRAELSPAAPRHEIFTQSQAALVQQPTPAPAEALSREQLEAVLDAPRWDELTPAERTDVIARQVASSLRLSGCETTPEQIKGHLASAGEVLTDDAMADALNVAMRAKLAKAREKGRGGWENPDECTVSDLWRMMIEHAHKPNLDMVDVANFAGMIWWRLDHNPGEREELLRTLAQAHADQQARLRGLVGTWRGRAMVDRSYGRTVNASTYEKCADELEAVLGGKE